MAKVEKPVPKSEAKSETAPPPKPKRILTPEEQAELKRKHDVIKAGLNSKVQSEREQRQQELSAFDARQLRISQTEWPDVQSMPNNSAKAHAAFDLLRQMDRQSDLLPDLLQGCANLIAHLPPDTQALRWQEVLSACSGRKGQYRDLSDQLANQAIAYAPNAPRENVLAEYKAEVIIDEKTGKKATKQVHIYESLTVAILSVVIRYSTYFSEQQTRAVAALDKIAGKPERDQELTDLQKRVLTWYQFINAHREAMSKQRSAA